MNGRIKIGVKNERGQWRYAYCKPELVLKNLELLKKYFPERVKPRTFWPAAFR